MILELISYSDILNEWIVFRMFHDSITVKTVNSIVSNMTASIFGMSRHSIAGMSFNLVMMIMNKNKPSLIFWIKHKNCMLGKDYAFIFFRSNH